MTPELARYYENRLDMTSTEAWKDLIQDIEAMLESTNKLDGVTEDNLKFKQGEISIMRWLLNLRDISETAYDELRKE